MYVARSYTPSLTVPSLLISPSFYPTIFSSASLHFTYLSIIILPTHCSSLLIICPYQFRIHPLRFRPCTFGASIPYSFIPYHVELCNFAYPWYSIFFIVPSAMSLSRSYHCHVQLPLGSSRSFSVTQHSTYYLPVLLTVLHAEGNFCIQLSIFL